jgi:hypothetical protein
MGLTIVLETEDAGALETVEDPTNLLHRMLPAQDEPGFSILSCIDSYGDTVFNRLQSSGFIGEWSRLKDRLQNVQERDLWDRIQKLAERVAQGRHLYLKFYGD